MSDVIYGGIPPQRMPVTKGVDSSFWRNSPFPHLAVDSWWQNDSQLNRINNALLEISEPSQTTYSSSIEANKEIYNTNSFIGHLLDPIVEELTNQSFLDKLSELTYIKDIKPLTYWNEDKDTDYKYFHRMFQNGILGSHVDHSQIYNKKGQIISGDYVHFLNVIFYVNGDFLGGETCLYGKTGYGEALARIIPAAGRMLIFLHNSESFHGVSRLFAGSPRTTVYMDYYCPKTELFKMGIHNRFWKHRTTFVPKSIKHWRYFQWYLEWKMKRKLA